MNTISVSFFNRRYLLLYSILLSLSLSFLCLFLLQLLQKTREMVDGMKGCVRREGELAKTSPMSPRGRKKEESEAFSPVPSIYVAEEKRKKELMFSIVPIS